MNWEERKQFSDSEVHSFKHLAAFMEQIVTRKRVIPSQNDPTLNQPGKTTLQNPSFRSPLKSPRATDIGKRFDISSATSKQCPAQGR